jgi:hypothetical protein
LFSIVPQGMTVRTVRMTRMIGSGSVSGSIYGVAGYNLGVTLGAVLGVICEAKTIETFSSQIRITQQHFILHLRGEII